MWQNASSCDALKALKKKTDCNYLNLVRIDITGFIIIVIQVKNLKSDKKGKKKNEKEGNTEGKNRCEPGDKNQAPAPV